MGFLNWLQINWGNLVSTIGAAGLIFTAVELHREANARRVGNQFEITKQHREIWTQLYVQPELKRILNPAADLRKHPVTVEEKLFVTFLILHLASAYRAKRFGMVLSPEELRADISSFFGLPIPRAVWEQSKKFQDRDFIAFVENYRTP